jgi:type II secretory pathway component PulM
MSEPDSRDARHSTRLSRSLLWAGAGLAPVAVLVLLVGGTDNSTRFAVLLLAVAIVVLAAAQLIRTDPVLLRDDAEQLVLRETDALRDAVGEDIAGAVAASAAQNRQILDARLQELQREVRRLSAAAAPPPPAPVADQTAGVRRSARVAPAEPSAPRPAPPRPPHAAGPVPPGHRAAPDAAPVPSGRRAAPDAEVPRSRRADDDAFRAEPVRPAGRRAAADPDEDSGSFRPDRGAGRRAAPDLDEATFRPPPVRAAAAARVVVPEPPARRPDDEVRPPDGTPRPRQATGAARVPVPGAAVPGGPVPAAAVRVPPQGAAVSRGAAVVPQVVPQVEPQSPAPHTARAADDHADVAWWAEEDVQPFDDFEREPPRRHRTGKSERW